MRENEWKYPGPMFRGPGGNSDLGTSSVRSSQLIISGKGNRIEFLSGAAGDGIVSGTTDTITAKTWNIWSVGIAGNSVV